MNNETLVQYSGDKLDSLFIYSSEPAFFELGSKLCPEFNNAEIRKSYLGYLRHRLVRKPRDLLSHLRRILLAHADNQPELTYEALKSIFEILDKKGESLRANLLERCRTQLSEEQTRSLLSVTNVSDTKLSTAEGALVIQSFPVNYLTEGNALDDARTFLENGQVELAQALLEKALDNEPENVELTAELIEIYRRSRNRAAAELMLRKSIPLNSEISRMWDHLLSSMGDSR